jgi:hypothetical protein
MKDTEQQVEELICCKCGVTSTEYPGSFLLAGNGKFYAV